MYEFELSIIALLVSIGTVLFTVYKTRPIEKKQMDFSALSYVMSVLSSIEQQDARRLIYDIYNIDYPEGRDKSSDKKKMNFSEGSEHYVSSRKIISAFDQVGVLVMNGVVGKKIFLDLYAGMVIRSYEALKEEIDRGIADNEEFCRWFRDIHKLAVERYEGKPLPRVYKRKSNS